MVLWENLGNGDNIMIQSNGHKKNNKKKHIISA